jgi:hypothetical protein
MQTTARIQSLFEKTKPVCFTRFLVDVPVTAKVVYARMTVDLEIVRNGGIGERVNELIAEQIRHDKDREEIFLGEGSVDELAGNPLHDPNGNFVQLVSISGKDEYSVRTYRRINDDLYEFIAYGFRGSDVKPEMTRQAGLIMAMRSRREDEIPNEEGVCIDGAFIPARRPQYENIQIGIRFAEFPDVHLSIYTIKNDKYITPDSYFWGRFKDAEELARLDGFGTWYDNIRQLRKGDKKAGIWNGVELLARLPPQPNRKGSDYHQFNFQAGGKENDRFYPNVDIQLDTGVSANTPGKVPASLTDDELIALWDKVLSSIRIREVTPPKPDAPRVGLMLPPGALCPIDGQWECTGVEEYLTDHEIVGGKIQFFRTGVILPHPTLTRPGNLWQRLTEKHPTFHPAGNVFWKMINTNGASTLDLALVYNPTVNHPKD